MEWRIVGRQTVNWTNKEVEEPRLVIVTPEEPGKKQVTGHQEKVADLQGDRHCQCLYEDAVPF